MLTMTKQTDTTALLALASAALSISLAFASMLACTSEPGDDADDDDDEDDEDEEGDGDPGLDDLGCCEAGTLGCDCAYDPTWPLCHTPRTACVEGLCLPCEPGKSGCECAVDPGYDSPFCVYIDLECVSSICRPM